MIDDSESSADNNTIEWKKHIFLLLGMLLFAAVYYSPPWSDALDPIGKQFVLSRQGKGALAVALLAATWWVFEVVPVGITSLAIGVLQALFFIRPARSAFIQNSSSIFSPSRSTLVNTPPVYQAS